MKFVRICLFALVTGLFLTSCEKDMSFEAGSATGVLTDDGSGDCLPATIHGNYVIGTPLTAANTVDIQVNFSTEGVYDIRTDTINGYSFRAIGSVSTSGLATIHLLGTGTPVAGGTGVDIFHIVYGLSSCSFNIVLGGIVVLPGTITATVGGTFKSFNVNAASSQFTDPSLPGYNIMEIAGDSTATGNESVVLDIAIPAMGFPTAGTSYDIGGTGATYYAGGEYDDASGTNNYFGTTGFTNPTPIFTIHINTITPTRVTGTFQGDLYKSQTGPGTISIVGGTFDVPR